MGRVKSIDTEKALLLLQDCDPILREYVYALNEAYRRQVEITASCIKCLKQADDRPLIPSQMFQQNDVSRENNVVN